jgi:hypothetical protein
MPINLARISLLQFLTLERFINSKQKLERIMSMKTIKSYLVVFVSLAVLFGSHAYIFAAEQISSIMCDNGMVNIGDMDVDVQAKCGEPNSQNMNEWVYNFGPSLPIYTVIFNEGKVVRILEDDQGN